MDNSKPKIRADDSSDFPSNNPIQALAFELARSRANLRMVLDNSDQAISSVDRDFRLVTFNAVLEGLMRQIWGIELQVGMDLGAHIPSEDESAFWQGAYQRAFANEQFTLERIYDNPMGRAIVEFSFNPIREGEAISGVAVFGRDITTERATLEALSASEFRYRQLFETSPLPMWFIDVETLKFLRVNRAACELFGFSEAEFLTKTVLDIRSPEEQAIFLKNLLPQFQDLGDEIPIVARYVKKNGEQIDALLHPHVVEFKGRTARFSLVTDITERLKAERELMEANERFRLAADAVTAVIYDWDIVTGHSIDTPGLLPLLGFDASVDENIDNVEWWMSRIHPDDRPHAQAVIDRALQKEKQYEVEYRVKHRDGYYVSVWDRGIIERDAAGKAVRVVGSAQDISERKALEAQLEQERNKAIGAKEKAEEMNRLKSSFLANMSHEIRTPMTAIMGFASVLAESIKDPEQHEYATIIESSCTRLLATINSILDLAQVESHQIAVSLAKHNVNVETQRTCALLEPLAARRKLRLQFSPTLHGAEALIDPQQFDRIVTNLLGNAIKFTDEGDITVRIKMNSEAEAPLEAPYHSFMLGDTPKEEYFRLIVEDTGIGIPPERLSDIFDEFQQGSNGLNRTHPGTGLGLTIASRLVEAMGGSIEVRSAIGVGSTFIVRLPRNMSENVVEEARTSDPATRATILLVEDTPEAMKLVDALLGTRYNLLHATNIYQARQALGMTDHSQAQSLPDLILMDINLGEFTTGLDLTRELKRNPRTAQVPVVAVTAFAGQISRETALGAGCVDYLTKPFTSQQLSRILERNLQLEASM